MRQDPPAIDYLPELKAFGGVVLEQSQAGCVDFSDQATSGWHVANIQSADLDFRQVHLQLKASFAADADVNLVIYGYGDRLILEVSPDGTVLSEGASDAVDVSFDAGVLTIRADFLNLNSFLFIGASQTTPIYVGTGKRLFTLTQFTAWTSEPDLDDRLRIIDVGAAGGLQPQWARRASLLRPILFEPNESEAERTREVLSTFRDAEVIETALSNIDGFRNLHVARAVGCTSVLKPNADILDRYGLFPIFETVQTTSVRCARYDTLHRQGIVPDPDVIKIDVQGYEYEVLSGFGGLLQNCLGIELEAHFYPIYQGQKLLSDLVDLLDGYGLVLRSIRPVPNFRGDIVEVDAFFTRASHHLSSLSKSQKKKYDILNVVWGLPDHWPRAEQA